MKVLRCIAFLAIVALQLSLFHFNKSALGQLAQANDAPLELSLFLPMDTFFEGAATTTNVSRINTSSISRSSGPSGDLISSVTKLSNGTSMYENVCILHEQETNVLISSRPLSINMSAPFGQMPIEWSTKTVANTTLFRNLMMAQQHATTSEWDGATLLFLNLFGNPAHCMNDMAFSIAMELSELKFIPQYKRFVLFEKPVGPNSWLAPSCQNVYCCYLMELLGILKATSIVYPNRAQHAGLKSNNHPDQPTTMCFSKLIVPHYANYRIPMYRRQKNAIRMLQQHAFRQLAWSNLTSEPWPRSNINNSVVPKTIWLKDRAGSGRRRLANSKALQQALEEQYHVHILADDLVTAKELKEQKERNKGYSTAGILEQAVRYNSHRYIIEVHGASMAHLFFGRPNTHVLEIQCATPPFPPDYYTFKKLNNSQWFSSYVGDLGMHYYTHREHEGCLENGRLRLDYSPANLTVDVPSMVQTVAQQFGLVPKSVDSSATTTTTASNVVVGSTKL